VGLEEANAYLKMSGFLKARGGLTTKCLDEEFSNWKF
jgi:hypothetical protein